MEGGAPVSSGQQQDLGPKQIPGRRGPTPRAAPVWGTAFGTTRSASVDWLGQVLQPTVAVRQGMGFEDMDVLLNLSGIAYTCFHFRAWYLSALSTAGTTM